MSKKYDFAVVVGRFNPMHTGHESLINHAFSVANNVIVLIGSSGKPRDIKNPFTAIERAQFIKSVFPNLNLTTRPICDFIYNDQKWVMQVQERVDQVIEERQQDPDVVKICLVGGKKDESSYYLDMFPQWDFIEHKFPEDQKLINATDIRELLFTCQTNEHKKKIKPFLNEKVFEMIEQHFKTNWFKNLILEYDHIKRYKEAWMKAPYAPTFITTDAVVICSGHILMIERRAAPGKGLLALPGGFLNQNERIEDGMIRELREETKLKVPTPIIKGSIKKQKVFDHPSRSLRGRTVTHASLVDLGIGELPRVKGSDDATKAIWLALNELNREKCFEDHYDIIQDMIQI